MSKYLMVPPGFEPDSTSSDSEPEPNQYIIKPSAPITELLSSSSDEEDSDEPMTGPESDSEGSDPKVDAMVGVPRGADSGAGEKSVLKRKTSETEKRNKKSGGSDSGAGEKSVLKRKTSETEKQKKKSVKFDRFFPEEDEIVLLNGMIRFAEEKKYGPLANLDAFRKFVKADLKVDPTTEQLRHKIYKFRWKYNKNLMRETRGNARRLRAHERRAYELSKLAWANEYIKCQKSSRGKKAAAKRANAKVIVGLPAIGGGPIEKAATETGIEIVSVGGSVDKTNSSRNGAQSFEKGKGVQEELEWVELMKAEMEVYLKKVELMHAKTSRDLDVLRSKNC